MELLGTVKGALAWFGGAIAALTALCYGAGYFGYHAHLAMLGLSGAIAFPHEQMLVEGSQFLLVLLSELLTDAFYALILAIGLVLIWTLVRRIGLAARIGRHLSRLAAPRWKAMIGRHPHLPSSIALVLLVACIATHNDLYLDALRSLGPIKHLLFVPTQPLPCATFDHAVARDAGHVAAGLIVRGELCRGALENEFIWLVRGYFILLAGLALLMAKPGTRVPEPARTAAKIVAGLYALIYLLWLPIAFGVLVRAPIYPIAEVAVKDGPVAAGPLLEQTSDGLYIWQRDSKAATWYPADKVAWLRVTQVGNIFERQESQDGVPHP